eukprot:6164907-Amphidinium_carterae.1
MVAIVTRALCAHSACSAFGKLVMVVEAGVCAPQSRKLKTAKEKSNSWLCATRDIQWFKAYVKERPNKLWS